MGKIKLFTVSGSFCKNLTLTPVTEYGIRLVAHKKFCASNLTIQSGEQEFAKNFKAYCRSIIDDEGDACIFKVIVTGDGWIEIYVEYSDDTGLKWACIKCKRFVGLRLEFDAKDDDGQAGNFVIEYDQHPILGRLVLVNAPTYKLVFLEDGHIIRDDGKRL